MKYRIHTPIVGLAAVILSVNLTNSTRASEREVERLRKDIAELREELEEREKKSGGLGRIVSNIETAEAEIEAAKAEFPRIEKEIEEMEFLREIYRSAFRSTTSLQPGEDLGTFRLSNGETVSNAVFVGAGQGEVKVQTTSGLIAIPVSQLPDAVAGKIQGPPSIDTPTVTLADLKASKPDHARTAEEIAEEKRKAEEAAREPELAETETQGQEKKVDEAPAVDEHEAAKKRNEARMIRINQLKREYSDVYEQKKRARQKKYDQERQFRQAKIKKAQAEINSTLSIFDSQIENFEIREKEIKDSIADLRSELE